MFVSVFAHTHIPQAIQELGSDIIIVGRGIYTSANVVETARLYQERAFSSYLERINSK